jgi:hypothetical protein
VEFTNGNRPGVRDSVKFENESLDAQRIGSDRGVLTLLTQTAIADVAAAKKAPQAFGCLIVHEAAA